MVTRLCKWSLLLSLVGYNPSPEEYKSDAGLFAQQSIYAGPELNINRLDMSECYFYDDKSFVTISIEFSWTDAPPGDSVLIEIPNTVNRYAYLEWPVTNEKEEFIKFIPLSSPQVIAIELPSDGQFHDINLSFTSIDSVLATTNFQVPDACPFLFCGEDSTRLSGMAFLDLNFDGARQFGETSGYEGMIVHLFECFPDEQIPVRTTTTSASGEYSFTGLEPGREYKVVFEFDANSPFFNTSGDLEYNDLVQFPKVPDCNVNVSVIDKGLNCERNPQIAVVCYVHGDPPANSPDDSEVLLQLDYEAEGLDNSLKTPLAVASEAGSLWGLAWNKNEQMLYASAMLRRHSALGPLGLAGIYRRDNFELKEWFDLSFGGTFDFGSIGTNADRGLAISHYLPSVDSAAFYKFGKVGIGGIDIDPAGEYLFACNLFDGHIYKVAMDADNDISTPPVVSDVERISIPSPCDPFLGMTRPWALKVFDNNLYVGLVCDASISGDRSDMRGYIYVYDLILHQWVTQPAADFPLTYPKGSPATHISPFNECGLWNPWNEDYENWCKANLSNKSTTAYYSNPQPIISDLEFDVDGSLVIALIDRSSFMTGNEDYAPDGLTFMKSISAAGDVLRAMKFKDIYVLENNGSCGPSKGLLAGNKQGPGFGEFFNDNYNLPDSTLIHAELAMGALAVRPGSNQLIYNAVDPLSYTHENFSGGLRWHNNTTGAFEKAYIIYKSQVLPSFAKSAGLGDIELQCNKYTDITIGNYIWLDFNRNGIQDACEPPIEGINVTLLEKNGTEVGTVQSDSTGRYFFRSTEYPSLTPNTEYDIVFATYGQYNTDLRISVSGIGRISVSLSNREYGAFGDDMDSDATIFGFPQGHKYYTYPSIQVRTPDEGKADLSFDLGMVFVDYAIQTIVTNEKPLPYLKGEEVTYRLVVYNYGGLPGYNVEAVCYLTDGMLFFEEEQSAKGDIQKKSSFAFNDVWTRSGDTLVYATIDTLFEGASDTLELVLQVTNGYGPDSWNLYTEVSNAYNVLGESTAMIDLDADLDRNKYNNGGSQARSPADNYLYGDGTATEINGIPETDQDNVDPAIVNILDVALQIYPDPQYEKNYDSIKYVIVVQNQGSFDADSVQISLKYSDAYCYNSDDNSALGWTLSDQFNVIETTLGELKTLNYDTTCVYLKALTGAGKDDWVVHAEISKVIGLGNQDISHFEIDSELNADFTDNVGGMINTHADDYLLGFGDATERDSIAQTDQDNADPACILPTDMALKLVLDDELLNSSISINDTVKYLIQIYNQGRDTITEVGIVNYKAPCLIYNQSLNPTFIEEPDGYTTTVNTTILPYEMIEIPIYLTIFPGADCEYINAAEITSFREINGQDLSLFDIDSDPDRLSSNDPLIIDELGRILVDSSGPCDGTFILLDEDDHDIAPIPKYDLALRNEILTEPSKYGDTVCYMITIFNQGNQPVKDIDVINYLPAGLDFIDGINDNWVRSGDNVIYTHEDLLYGEDSVEVILKLAVVSATPDSLAHLSIAEISSMYNANGVEMNGADLDSKPDRNPDNDIGGVPMTLSDDHIDDDAIDSNMDGIFDEDDQDPAFLEVFDLSISKMVVAPKVYHLGDIVQFRITVTNDGSETALGFSVVDYLPTGLSFYKSDNLLWDISAHGWPEIEIAQKVLPGESVDININLRVNQNAQLSANEPIKNVAEIYHHFDSQLRFNSDFDSDPDQIIDNDLIEDDQDSAFIEVAVIDPRGAIYCDATGQLVTDGKITITRAQDGVVIQPTFAIDDNLDTLDGRNGLYEFVIPTNLILGGIDTFSISYIHPDNLLLSETCNSTFTVFNADGMGTNGRVVLGDTTLANDVLTDFNCGTNPYFTQFILTDTTPIILGNNLPIRCGTISGLVCSDRGTNAVPDPGESLLVNRTVTLYECSDTINAVQVTSTGQDGRYTFNGLMETCYRVQVTKDQEFVSYPNTTFNESGWSGDLAVDNGKQILDNHFCFPILDCDSIFCNANINVSVTEGCQFVLVPDLMLQGIIPRNDFIQFAFEDEFGELIISDTIPGRFIGKCLDVVSTTVFGCSFSPCISKVCLEDKITPQLVCNTDTIFCNEVETHEIPSVEEACFAGTIDLLSEQRIEHCQIEDFVAKHSRTYQATDEYGNKSAPCSTELFIKALDSNNIQFPDDTTINCSLSIAEINNMTFGLPTHNGVPINLGVDNVCYTSLEYTDQVIKDTPCEKLVLRMWSFFQLECVKEQLEIILPQQIRIVDETPPISTLPDTLATVFASYDCFAYVDIDLGVFSDDCNNITSVLANSEHGSVSYSDSELLRLPAGGHHVEFIARDACHIELRDTVFVSVVDNIPPLSVCVLREQVVLDAADTVVIVDLPSLSISQNDNCNVADIKVRKMDVSCSNQDTVFGNSVTFCCNDIGNEVLVLLEVSDSSGNSNTCMSIIEVSVSDPLFNCTNEVVDSLEDAVLITGSVMNRGDLPASNVEVRLSTNRTTNRTTDRTTTATNKQGNYEFQLDGSVEQISTTPYDNDNWGEGLSTIDALKIQKHTLGTVALEGLDLIAADINNDGNVSGLDLIYLRRLILGLIDKVEGNTSWKFIEYPKYTNAAVHHSPMEMYIDAEEYNIDWLGIKVGDILNEQQSNATLTQNRSTQDFQLYYDAHHQGDHVVYNFWTAEPIEIYGFQGKIDLPHNLRLEGVLHGQLNLMSEYFFFNESENEMSISYSQPVSKSIQSDKYLFSILAKVSGPIENQELDLLEYGLQPELYLKDGVKSFDLNYALSDARTLELYQNFPNPWSDETLLQFNLPSSGNTEIEIIDINGKIVWSQNSIRSIGNNTLRITNKMLPTEGVYVYKIKNGDKSTSGKMIRIK